MRSRDSTPSLIVKPGSVLRWQREGPCRWPAPCALAGVLLSMTMMAITGCAPGSSQRAATGPDSPRTTATAPRQPSPTLESFVLEGDLGKWEKARHGRDPFANDAGECLVKEELGDRVDPSESSREHFARCMNCRGWNSNGTGATLVSRAEALATPAAKRARAQIAAKFAAATLETALIIESPATQTVHTDYVQVVGRVGKLSTTPNDVVIAIDFSDSTLAFSGVDLDRDASLASAPEFLERISRVHGEDSAYHRRFQQTDFDDSILVAELIAARVLADRIDPANTRAGLVFFADRATIVSGLDDPKAAIIEAIDAARSGFTRRLGRTNFGAAIRMSIRALSESPAPVGGEATRAILILSDGVPTEPIPAPEADAIAAANEAACLGIRIDAYALGEGAARGLPLYDQIVARTGGTLSRLSTPGDIALALYGLSFAGLEGIEILNLESGAKGEAIRTTPTGRFDGFLRLAEGPNTIEVKVVLSDGTTATEQRVIAYAPAREGDEAARQAQADLAERMRVRRLRFEFWAEMERVRNSRKKSLTVRPESEAERDDPALQRVLRR